MPELLGGSEACVVKLMFRSQMESKAEQSKWNSMIDDDFEAAAMQEYNDWTVIAVKSSL